MNILSTVFLTSLLVGQADIITEAHVGQLFVYELHREVFQREFEPFHKVFGMSQLAQHLPFHLHES